MVVPGLSFAWPELGVTGLTPAPVPVTAACPAPASAVGWPHWTEVTHRDPSPPVTAWQTVDLCVPGAGGHCQALIGEGSGRDEKI